jgi:YqeY-like protein
MLIVDLEELPGRDPSPYGAVERERDGTRGEMLLPQSTVLRAVGWLGNQVPSSGDTPPECIDRLLIAYESEMVFRLGGLGPHGCEICTDKKPMELCAPVIHWRDRAVQLYGHGHYLVRRKDIVYVTPALVLHYILDHRYRPPDEFVKAVIDGAILTNEDLVFVPRVPVTPQVRRNCALLDRLERDLKAAMKARESLRVSVLRVTLSEANNAGHRMSADMTDVDVVGLLRTEVEKREEASALYRRGNRPDLADREIAEAAILRAYVSEPGPNRPT